MLKSVAVIPTFLICLFLVSCEPEIVDSANTPEFVQKIVVYSYISPDNPVNYAYVAYNTPVFGEITTEKFKNGSVTISDGINEKQFSFRNDTFYLNAADFPINAGKNYILKVKDYKNNQVEASCLIPALQKINLQWDTITSSVTREWGIEKVFKITTRFNDVAGQANYYRLEAEYYSYYTDTINHYIGNYFYPIYNNMFSDYLNDGNQITQTIQIPGYSLPFIADSVKILIKLLQTDKNYYVFNKSLSNYNYDDDPFTEVTHLYSNVNGGLGVFCGYTKEKYWIRLK